MFVEIIQIPDQPITLIAPEASHAKLSFSWIYGKKGRLLLEKMGNNLPGDWLPSLAEEEKRIDDFINKKDQLNWAIEYKGKVVGAVWIDLREDHLIGPHIMIGDESAYGKGIATNVLRAVCDWALADKKNSLEKYNFNKLTTRCRVDNLPIIRVNEKIGFKVVGDTYDEDGFTWQNYEMNK